MKCVSLLTIVVLLVIFSPQNCFATIYEAETSVLHKAIIEDKNGGFSGDSYINFDNEPGSYLTIKIGMAEEGEQTIKIRFANGTTAARTMRLELNNLVISELFSFNPTGSWTNWDTVSIHAFLPAGVNFLKCISVSSEGGPNIDLFDISGEQAESFQLNLTTNGFGQITQSPENGLLFKDEEITLIARPDYNSVFLNWTGDFNSDNDTLKFILDSDKTITAHFVEIEVYPPEPDFAMMGYASVPGDGIETTTGGEGGKISYIQNLDQLIAWGESRENNSTPEIVIIKGLIEAENTTVISIKRGRNISIIGDSDVQGGFGELKNISLNIRQYSNVIIRNLKIREVFYPHDGLTIDECHHVWIDHCEFHSKIGPGIGVDTYDGLLDIKKGSHNVTVSWCRFYDHMKTVLIGHSDNNGEQDANLEVTFHHNWFSNTDGRNPSLRFGKVHYFNNYLENISDYGFAVRNGAHAKIENCHFESVNIPIATNKFEGHGFACISGCIYSGSSSENDNQISEPFDCTFWDNEIPYSYSLESTNTVKISVENYAGVGIVETITSAKEIDYKNDLKIISLNFNLSLNQFDLLFSIQKHENLTFTVYSSDGRKLILKTQDFNPGNHTIQFPISRLKTGLYILHIETSSAAIAKKVMF
jgi:pectate lyase